MKTNAASFFSNIRRLASEYLVPRAFQQTFFADWSEQTTADRFLSLCAAAAFVAFAYVTTAALSPTGVLVFFVCAVAFRVTMQRLNS